MTNNYVDQMEECVADGTIYMGPYNTELKEYLDNAVREGNCNFEEELVNAYDLRWLYFGMGEGPVSKPTGPFYENPKAEYYVEDDDMEDYFMEDNFIQDDFTEDNYMRDSWTESRLLQEWNEFVDQNLCLPVMRSVPEPVETATGTEEAFSALFHDLFDVTAWASDEDDDEPVYLALSSDDEDDQEPLLPLEIQYLMDDGCYVGRVDLELRNIACRACLDQIERDPLTDEEVFGHLYRMEDGCSFSLADIEAKNVNCQACLDQIERDTVYLADGERPASPGYAMFIDDFQDDVAITLDLVERGQKRGRSDSMEEDVAVPPQKKLKSSDNPWAYWTGQLR